MLEFIAGKIPKEFKEKSKIENSYFNKKIYSDKEKKLGVLFYGELYNKNELKETLINKGYDFKSDLDEEIILCGYKEYQLNFFNKLNGGFSFVLYDNNNDEIIIVRDSIGIKPMYYYKDNNYLIFSSSLKKLKTNFIDEINFEINKAVLENYLSFQYSVTEETFYKKIYKLLPGHFLIYKDGKVNINSYYIHQFSNDDSKSMNEYAKEIHKMTEKIVNDYEEKSNRITTFLSSGVDSSYINSLTSKVHETYTMEFENLAYNESKYAEELSYKLKKKNNIIKTNADKYFNAIKEISQFIDEPLADPSSVGLFLLCKEASKKYDTALIGEGADEFFGGYKVYQAPLELPIYNKVPFKLRKIISKFCSLLPQIKGINFLVRRGKKVEEWYIGNANIFSNQERKLILKNCCSDLRTDKITKKYYDIVKSEDDVTKMQYIDINLWLVGDELFNAEMMGNYTGIKLKAPFLNKKIVDLSLEIPSNYRINNKN